MGATELRILAHEAPAVANRLMALADKLDAHAEDAQKLAGWGPPSKSDFVPG